MYISLTFSLNIMLRVSFSPGLTVLVVIVGFPLLGRLGKTAAIVFVFFTHFLPHFSLFATTRVLAIVASAAVSARLTKETRGPIWSVGPCSQHGCRATLTTLRHEYWQGALE